MLEEKKREIQHVSMDWMAKNGNTNDASDSTGTRITYQGIEDYEVSKSNFF